MVHLLVRAEHGEADEEREHDGRIREERVRRVSRQRRGLGGALRQAQLRDPEQVLRGD